MCCSAKRMGGGRRAVTYYCVYLFLLAWYFLSSNCYCNCNCNCNYNCTAAK